ncbi:MAG: hypothetical protein ACJ76N_11910 [Thermoanaerobaculia bacterium]
MKRDAVPFVLVPFVLVPFVLVALAILLPGAVEAQDCCNCAINGTSCSECCYVDQWALCQPYGSPSHCGCTCVDNPDYFPGGGGVGCGSVRLSSQTLVIGSDRDYPGKPEKLADYQLQFGLLHPGVRREGSFNFEEWALVSSAGDVLGASTVEFSNRVQDVAERFRPRGKRTSTVLVIEDAEHPHNSREIPVPKVAPIDIDAGLPVNAAGQEAWFRAEVGEDGVVDEVALLNLPAAFASVSINDQLREHLSLRYADEGRHRVVVFGAVRVNAKGHLVMTRSRVVLPKCCCGGHHCV